jgi:hypothetical protein
VLIFRSPPSFSNQSEDWTITVSWNPRVSYGQVVLTGLDLADEEILIRALRSRLGTLTNPLQVLLILIDTMIDSDSSGVRKHGVVFQGIEEFMNNFSVEGQQMESTEGTLKLITSKVNTSSSGLAFHEMRLQSYLKTLEYMSEIIEHFEAVEGNAVNAGSAASAGKNTSDAAKYIKATQIQIANLLLQVQLYQRMAESGLEVVRT